MGNLQQLGFNAARATVTDLAVVHTNTARTPTAQAVWGKKIEPVQETVYNMYHFFAEISKEQTYGVQTIVFHR